MRAFFKRPVTIDGVFFAGGRDQEVPPAFREHWFFKALVDDGAVTISQHDETAAPAAEAKPTQSTEPVVDTPEKAPAATAEKSADAPKTGKTTRKRRTGV